MLWWVNMILHTFGWAITVKIEDGVITDCYPARVKTHKGGLNNGRRFTNNI